MTPSIVVKEEDVAPILTPMPTVELSNGLMDIVMVWRAPKTGQVQIEGQITKQHISLQSGVKFSIEKLKKDDMGKATFVYGPYLMLSNSDNHNITIDVSQGDLIFFRTHSNQTPAQELGVTWNPKVTYTKENFDSSLSYPQYSSSYQDSFVVGITKEELFKEQGRYKLEWPSFTLNAVDQVRVKVSYYKQNTSKTNTGLIPVIGNNIVIYDEVSGYNSSKTYYSPGKILDMNTINDNDPTSFHYIKVEVLADSEVNWKEIDQKFKPKLVSLDGKADVYLTPSYSNYNKPHTSYYPSNFNFSLNMIKIRVNHNFQLPNCSKKVCEDRYIHLIIKDDKNKIVSYNGSLLKFRYKLDANGNIILREQFDQNLNQYSGIGLQTDHTFQSYNGLKFYIEYYTSDHEVAERLKEYQNYSISPLVALVEKIRTFEYTLPNKTDYVEGGDNIGLFRANIYSSENVTGWGTMYRNWGQFAYKGPNANATYEPIVGKDIYLFHPAKTTSTGKGVEDIVGDPSLTLDAVDKNFDDIAQLGGNVSNSFAVLMPNKKRNHWESHERLYISETNVSPYTRFLTDEIPSLKPPTVPVQAYGAYGINKNSYFKNNTVNKSIGFLGLNAGDTRTEGYGSISNEFIDVNGDGFPDVVGDKIQLTSARGGLSQRIINNTFNMDVEVDGKGFLIGGSSAAVKAIPNYVKTLKSSTPTVRTATGNQVSGSLSNTNFVTKNNTKKFYLDINGDGLVDIIQSDGKVLMNYGNRFEEQQSTWNMSTIQTENVTRNFSGSGGYGYGKDTHKGFSNLDLSFGLSFSESQSEERVSYVDINGDGLPEKIVDGTTYYINLGTKFDTTARKLPQAQRQKALDGGINAGGTICVIIPIPFLMIGPKFCGSLGGAVGKNYSLDQVRYMDYDGDGYTDVVTSTRNDNVTVYFSRIKRTNLLKKVTQSTGATIELDYDVTNPVDKSVIGSTYKMPYKKWALTKVSVFDGFVGDGEDYTNYNYEYFNGYKDRKERNFLGFGVTKAHLLDKNGQVFRTDVTEYLLNDMTDDQLYRPGTSSDLKQYLYKKGLVKKVSSLDKEKKVLSESMYQYKFYDVNQLTTDINTSNVINAEVKNYTNKISVLPLLIKKENNLIHYEQGKSTSFTQSTTQKFTLYDKKGNIKQYVDVDRGLTVDMEYQIGNLKVLPISHRVSNTTGGQMLGLIKAISNDGIRIHEVRKYLNSTKYLTTNFEYDNIGNITKKIFPLVNGKRFSYEYDYVDTVSSANGNANPRKVFPSNIRDSYGNKTFNAYTAFGNVTKTIDMYNAEIEYEYDQLNRLRFVKGPYEKEWTIKHDFVDNRHTITQHNLGTDEQTKQPIILHTSIINDGLGRTLQVKKELMPNPDNRLCGNLPGVRLSVSGDVIYDEFGRVIENYLSEEEVDCNNANALRGRLLSYYNGARSVEKKISRLYDYRDRVTDELVHGTNALTKTKYGFGKDKLGKDTFTQEVTLPEGNKTISYINEFGLQTGQKQIGNGQELWTTSTYDNLGRVIQVEDALGRKSLYNYDWFGRVLSKNLPFSGITSFIYDDLGNIIKKTDSNGITINYTYDFNRLLAINEPSIQTNFTYDKGGRLEKMEDLSGKQNFKYGKLGEVIEDTKELMDIKGVKRYFTTRYKYDSWGRILEIVYPDREKVKYTYNRVGQLVQINGNKEYLTQVLYNHFNQPYYIKYGNGVETKQEFDLTERLRAVELKAPNKNNRNLLNVFSRNTYQYDLNNNIVSQENKFSQHNVLNVGGVSWKQYEYDDFNRLKNASGHWDGLLETHDFKLEMSYLKDHAIESKKQVHIIYDKNTKVSTPSENSLNRTYNYDSDKAQLKHLVVEKNNLNSDQNFEYDQQGNILSIDILNNAPNTGFQQRVFKWDANNNIVSIKDDAGKVVNYYTYDGKGERVSKKTGGEYSLSMNNNAPQTGIYLSEVLYPSGNLVVNEQYYTKHYYANGKRLASSINDLSQVDSFENSSFNNEKTSLHETDLKQKSSMSSKSVLNSKEEGRGILDPSVPIGQIDPDFPIYALKGFCQKQIDFLLNVFYNTPETSNCKDNIISIINKNERIERICAGYAYNLTTGKIECTRYYFDLIRDYCTALEEINKLDCIKRTSDGMIIDPVTGVPYDPVTGIPVDLGTKTPQDRLQLDCYNKFIRYINYYQKKQEKPEGYDEIAKYLKCIQPEYEQCYLCSQYEAVTRDASTGICTIDYCKINVPDIPEEPEVPVVIPTFPDRKLGPGVNDTWQDNVPANTTIIANPLDEEIPVWWYHSDHLGSSSYITDILGKPCQYIEYLPFGEVMTEQSTNNIFDNIYKFNGKELDESTGYYYYGARYYDPGMSIFLSVDPLAEKFPNWNPYHYVHNNPINLVDPTGMEAEGRENDYLFDDKNNLIAVTYTDSKDRYFTESAYSATSMKFQNSKGDIKHGEEFLPDFAIVEIMAEVEGAIGHSAIGFDGNTFNYYPTKDDGTTRDFGAGHLFGTDLQQVVSSQSDFKERYPLANSYFAKVSPEQKTSLSTSLSFKGEALENSGEKYNLIYNNCTTNVSNHLIGAGILGSDSYRRRPGTFNSMLKSSGNISGSISRESSIGRTVRNNVRESLNNMTVNGKRVK